jgi:hypothetical protein
LKIELFALKEEKRDRTFKRKTHGDTVSHSIPGGTKRTEGCGAKERKKERKKHFFIQVNRY